MLDSLAHGRRKGHLVCHAGRVGNEGKSVLYGPLPKVFGDDGVFLSPTSPNFPLMGLETARVALLDDWRFNERVLSYNMQLLWFEGKPVVIARPQNQFTGHLRYQKDAPIFITTLEADLLKIPDGLQKGDVEMMLKRLEVFRFHVPLVNPIEIPACARCFTEMLFRHAGPLPPAPLSAGSPVEVPASEGSGKRAAERPKGGSPETKKAHHAWSVEEVCSFLERLELGHVGDKFRENGVDGSFLAQLSVEDLVEELGLTKLQARKVITRFA